MDHSGDGDFFYFLFCEMIECRDDSSCADHGYNSADSDSYRAAGIDEADRKGNDDGGEIKKIFSETHVLSAALAENSCQAVGRVWDDVDVYGHSGADSRKMMARTRTRSRIPIWSGAGKIRSKMVIKALVR